MARTGLKAVLALFLLGAILLAAALVHYASVFNRLVDTRLARASAGAPAVYARPFQLRVGENAEPAAWKWRLELAGYRVDEPERGPDSQTRRLLVSSQYGAEPWQLAFRGGRLAALEHEGSPVGRASWGPEFLSSMAGAGRQKVRHIPLEEMPRQLVEAVLAAEDQRFHSHFGVDLLTASRAVAVNLWNWDFGQGGSTLTQQLVKNHLLTPEKRLSRKAKEIYFSMLLERRFSKEEILELYLNQIYLGQIGGFAIHGFGQAALSFFGKEVSELSLSETAALVGMIPAPNRYSPYRNAKAVLSRRGYVLDRMEAEGFINARQKAESKTQNLRFRPASFQESSQAPYFVDYVADLLERDYQLSADGNAEVAVYSTLDPALQRLAFQAVRQGLTEVEKQVAGRKAKPQPQAALIALDPQSGEILAWIGGRDYTDSPFNRAVYAFRQPGSTMKPFVLAAALQRSLSGALPLTLSSWIQDEPYTFEYEHQTYSPSNYGNRYHGMVTLRQALAQSLNVPTVKLAEMVGFKGLLDAYHRMDLGSDWKAYPSLALGTFELSLLELSQAYQVLANQGRLVPLSAIRRVEEKGRESKPSVSRQARQVFDRGVAFLVTSALQSVLEEGTGQRVRQLGFRLPAAGKTGSTQDSWFVGFTPELLCAVWVGTDGPPELHLDGSRAALPIWARFMQGAQSAGYLSPGRPLAVPPEVEQVAIDEETGLRATAHCEKVRQEFFLRGTAPPYYCSGSEVRAEAAAPSDRKKRGFLRWLGGVLTGRKP